MSALVAIETANEYRHDQRGHLIVRDVPGGIRVHQRPPLARLDAAAVAFPLDQPMCQH
jgi:hypothetical protein